MFTLDGFLTLINLIYKSLFCHQPFDDLLIYHQYNQSICKKKRNVSLDNILTIKIKIKTYKVNIIEDE